MHIEWQDAFATGYDLIDRQHRGLVGILNELHRELAAGCRGVVIEGVFGELQHFAERHFSTEESLMRQHGLTDAQVAGHAAEHDEYRLRVVLLRQRHAAGEIHAPRQLLDSVGKWWLGHIMGADRVFAALAGKPPAPARPAPPCAMRAERPQT